ncbi:hypothetical protein ACS8Y6_04405 [Salinisphaera sp. RV14]|uniref:hypothetical protein n=1 Tax=Salinisphaera sp. RV14 TaxID=3454140 RepID=UPI003F85FB58
MSKGAKNHDSPQKNKNDNLLTDKQRKEVASRLEERGVRNACPMCGGKSWTVADGYFNQALQGELKGMVLGGPSIPSAALICTNCGFMSQHALGALGLLPSTTEDKS